MTTQLNIRMDEKLKTNFIKTVEAMGLTPSSLINLLAKQVVIKQRIPFDIEAPALTEVEKRAKLLDDAMDAGLISDNRPIAHTNAEIDQYLNELRNE
jgi:DNA-damage-inducible protein J